MTYADTTHDVRDPELPGRLLTTERDALIPLLRARPDDDFALATLACPGWTVRDVLAHCAATLTRSRSAGGPPTPFRQWGRVHAGDVRDVLGAPGAYGGQGLGSALTLLARVTRQKNHQPLHADLDDLDDPLRLGDASGELTPARYIGDAATLVRLYAGRPVPDGVAYELAGAKAEELNIFG